MFPPLLPRPNLAEIIRDDFRDSASFWFSWLSCSIRVVIIGLLFEGPELAHEIWIFVQRIGRKRRDHAVVRELKTIVPLSIVTDEAPAGPHTPTWVKVVKLAAFIGWFLVVAGVAGELFFEKAFESANDIVQKFDEILVTEARNQARDAATSAKTAHEEADAVKTEADAFRQKLSVLEARAEQLRKDQEDRKFRRSAGGRLKKYRWDANARMISLEFDVEYSSSGCHDCKNLAEQIVRVLHKYADWSLYGNNPDNQPHGDPNVEDFEPDVVVSVNTEGDPPIRAKAFSDAVDALVAETTNMQHIVARRKADVSDGPIDVVLIRVGDRERLLPPRGRTKAKP